MSTEPVTSPADIVHFKARHRPALASGQYTVSARHTISATGAADGTQFDSDLLTFGVFGPRYVIHDSDVESEFPPSGAVGKFGEVLPHIILSRATVPWERSGSAQGVANADRFPWLALLIFSEGEATVRNLTVGTIKPTDNLSALFQPIDVSNLPAEPVDVSSSPVTVVDVSFSLLKQLLPDPTVDPATHFSLLSHTRSIDFVDPRNPPGAGAEERAVIVACRLPEQGKRIHAHLVSLEGCYEHVGSTLRFLGGRPLDSHTVRLVSLYSWDFFCQADDADSFDRLVKRLDAGRLRVKSAAVAGASAVQQEARRFTESGFVPLVHRFRQGDRTVSWYHGPLLPASTAPFASPPAQFAGARAADDLLLYDSRQGMFDVSYAAAWELGRMLMLENTRLASALYGWKRARAQAQAGRAARNLPVRKQGMTLGDLPLGGKTPDEGTPPFPAEVAAWFQNNLDLLAGIPFCYLIPDQALLPKESLRFFFVDRLWMQSVFDGAFAVTRFTLKDVAFDSALRSELPASRVTAGVLIRSAVVSGWPGLSVDGFSTSSAGTRDSVVPGKLTVLRQERLAPDVLLVLFDGAPRAVDLHLSAETVHFGLDEPVDGVFHKTLRATVVAGPLRPVVAGQQVAVPALNAARRVDIVGLAANVLSAARRTPISAAALTDADVASFALEMIESVPVTRFNLT